MEQVVYYHKRDKAYPERMRPYPDMAAFSPDMPCPFCDNIQPVPFIYTLHIFLSRLRQHRASPTWVVLIVSHGSISAIVRATFRTL